MLKIRLQRVGRKHQPAFRLVLTDAKNSTKSGRFKEVLGSYDPGKINEVLKADRIKHWLSTGATATATVHNLLVKKGIVRGKKIDVSAGEAPAPAPAPENNSQPTTDNPQPEAPAPEAPAETPAPESAPEPVAPEATPAPEEAPAPAPTETA